MRGEEEAHGDRPEARAGQTRHAHHLPLPPHRKRHPLKAGGDCGRGKRKVEGVKEKELNRRETGQWDGGKRDQKSFGRTTG